MPKPSRVLLFMAVSMFLVSMPWYGFSAVLPRLGAGTFLAPRRMKRQIACERQASD